MKSIFIILVAVLIVAGFYYTLDHREELSKNWSKKTPGNIAELIKEQNIEASGEQSVLREEKNDTEETAGQTVVEGKKLSPPDKAYIEPDKKYFAVLSTAEGDIIIALNSAGVPNTVNNFVYLAKNNFFNGTIFHRVIKDFMIQGGDPNGDGTGNPGYYFPDEKFTGDYKRGIVAMANAGPNTNGSQFFIMTQDASLEKNYTIFGEVIQGLEVVDKIAAGEVVEASNGQGEISYPVSPVTINKVEIVEQ